MKTSTFFNLNLQDLAKGIITAFITALLTGLYELLTSGSVINWAAMKIILLSSVAAMISYLIKNLFTNSEGKFLKREPYKNLKD